MSVIGRVFVVSLIKELSAEKEYLNRIPHSTIFSSKPIMESFERIRLAMDNIIIFSKTEKQLKQLCGQKFHYILSQNRRGRAQEKKKKVH